MRNINNIVIIKVRVAASTLKGHTTYGVKLPKVAFTPH